MNSEPNIRASLVAEHTQHAPEQQETVFQPGFSFYAAFSSILVIALAAALDATSLSVALPIISKDLNGSAIEAFWSGTSFLLASTVFQPTFASLSHTFGRKPFVLLSVVLFAVGAIIAGVADNFTTLLAGRSVQGVGGGGILSLSEVVITDLVPLRHRGTYFGYQSSVWALGSVFGPIIGGAFAERVSWRWIFWINLPICGVGLASILWFLRLHRPPGNVTSKLLRFDWIGAFLLTAASTTFLIPITWGGVSYSWSSWRTLVPLILGACGLIGFGFYEIYIARNPVIPSNLFRQPTALVNYFGTFIHGVVLWSLLYYLPLYYEGVKNYSPLIVGVAVFPETFTVAPASVIVGVLMSHFGRFRWAIWSGWTLTTLGMGLLYLLTPSTSTAAWIFLNLVPGIGLGMLLGPPNYAIQAPIEQADVGFAAAMYTFSRSFGQSVGVAIGGTTFQGQLMKELLKYPELAPRASELAQDASGLVRVIQTMPLESAERLDLVEAYADALKVVWAVMAGLAFAALLASLITKHYSLNEALVTEQAIRETRLETSEYDFAHYHPE